MKYRVIILESENRDSKIAQEYMMKLLHWKDNREIFWEENVVIEATAQPPPSFTTDENMEEVWEQEEFEQMRSMDLIPEHDVAFLMDPDVDFKEQSSENLVNE